MRASGALFAALAALLLGGCAHPRSRAEEVDLASAISRARMDTRSDYKISAADLLQVTVFDNEKLNREVRVTQNGTISLPLIGLVTVGGLTVIDAERALADKLRQFVIEPQVNVLIKTEGVKKVFVLGQVLRPGACELPTESRLTVLGAISMAGGFTPIAAPRRTRVIRNVNGRSETLFIDVSAATKRPDRERDFDLEPGDIVWVPQSYL